MLYRETPRDSGATVTDVLFANEIVVVARPILLLGLWRLPPHCQAALQSLLCTEKPKGGTMFPIYTDRLTLRHFEPTDADSLYEFYRRPDVVQYLYWNPQSKTDTEKMLFERLSPTHLAQDNDKLVLAVVLTEIDKLIGEVSLAMRSREHQQGEIGFALNPVYQGNGYATEATQVALRLGFEQYSFHRLFGRCDARNKPSARLMERLGMRREAHFIHNEIFKGEWGDELVYAILQNEWQRTYHLETQQPPP